MKSTSRILWLLPMSFLFHWMEINLDNGFFLAVLGTIIYILFTGILSIKMKTMEILPTGFLSIGLSILLGNLWLTPPNASWFNPVGMNAALVFTSLLIFIGVFVVRFITKQFTK